MVVQQCDYCRRPFQSYGSKTCIDCLTLMEESMRKIRDYLYEFPGAGVEVTSSETRVPIKMITYLLKDGRLLLVDNHVGISILSCEVCKKPISTGRLCNPCRENLVRTMDEKVGTATVAPKKEPKDKRSAKIDID